MSRIFTKTGDEGMTRLADGTQVQKTDIRIEANGCLDELNATLGMAKALIKETDTPLVTTIERIQNNLMDIMAVVAGCQKDCSIFEEETNLMESIMRTSKTPFNFVLPGQNTENAILHTARAKARTCERRLWEVDTTYNIPHTILVYINRLSDYLFFLAEKNQHG